MQLDDMSFFTDAAIADVGTTDGLFWVRYHSIMGYEGGSPTFGPGSPLAAGDAFESFLTLEVVHDGAWPNATERGMSRYGLELSRAMRVVAPQIEQYPVLAELMCTGGGELSPTDPRAGYWCYDATGTAGIYAMIDQAAAAGVDMLLIAQVRDRARLLFPVGERPSPPCICGGHLGSGGRAVAAHLCARSRAPFVTLTQSPASTPAQNMNETWRSEVGCEFQGAENVTWLANVTAYAKG